MLQKRQITGLILAGGRGSRMGGRDKGWISYQDQPMIQHALAGFSPQVETVIISANRELTRYQALGQPIVEDVISGFAGPLAGIHAGLQHCKTEWMATIPVDSPHIRADLIALLISAQQQSKADIIFASDGEFPQPVFLLINVALLPSIEVQLQLGDGKIMRWVKQQNHSECVIRDKKLFENKNKPEDLQI